MKLQTLELALLSVAAVVAWTTCLASAFGQESSVASVSTQVIKPFDGSTSTDWYDYFRRWDEKLGAQYVDGPDGGSIAWGPSAYTHRAYLNLYQAFGDVRWIEKFVKQTDRILAVASDRPVYAGFDPRYVDGFKGWGQNRYVQYQPRYTEWFCDDGLIIAPILIFVELVWSDERLHSEFLAKADDYVAFIEQHVIAKWYARWDPDPGYEEGGKLFGADQGYHLYDWAGWRNQPLNMYLSFTDALLTLRRLAETDRYGAHDPRFPMFYRNATDKMIANFFNQLKYQPQDDLYVWNYGLRSAWPHLPEDVGHGFVDIQASLQAQRGGICFNEEDLHRLARTFIHRIWNGSLSDPEFHYYVDGTPNPLDGDRGRWAFGFLYLAKYEYQIWESLAAYYERFAETQPLPPNLAACTALLAVATQHTDRWAPSAPSNVTIRHDDQGTHLSWQAPATDADGSPLTGLRGYRVYAAETADGPYRLVPQKPVTDTSFNDATTSERPRRSYRITAIDHRRPPNESQPAVP